MNAWKTTLVATALVSSTTLNAASIFQDQTSGGTTQILAYSEIGQSFTAEDDSIASIGFYVSDMNSGFAPSFDLSVELFEGVGFGGASLGTAAINLSDGFAGYADFDFSFVNLNIGNNYSAQLISQTARGGVQANQHTIGSTPIDGKIDYLGGDYIINGNLSTVQDARFRVIAASPVPVPAAVWLFGSGLIGLVGFARRKKS